MADRDQGSEKKLRQRIIIVVLVLVAGIFAWLMFGGKSAKEEEATAATAATPHSAAPAPMPAPKPAELPKPPAPLTQREIELIQLQQETEAKYLAAVNELQMLKIQRDIAETNKAIANAKLDTVNAQKNIVTLLTPEQSSYTHRLSSPTSAAPVAGGAPTDIIEVNYSVISVSEIQGRWGAVMGSGGKLYNVHVGDVLPADNSKVVGIDRSGVTLQQNGTRRTISLMPII